MGQSLAGWAAGQLKKGKSTSERQEMTRLIAAEIPRLRRFALLMAHDGAFADDLVQEALLRAVSHFDSWEPGTNLRAWLLTILRNVFLTELRRSRVAKLNSERSETWIDAQVSAIGNSNRNPQDFAVYLAAVQRAFDRLSSEHREILALVALEELSYEEAAATLNVPVGTVRSRLSRARAALRQIMSASARAESSTEPRPFAAIDSKWRLHLSRS
jgi:RNA polymerase sigma-70 factor (ECF subfamily)